jgi:hypothetical protein
MGQVPELRLSGAEVRAVAAALEVALSASRRNGRAPSAELRQAAAKAAAAVPLVALYLPALLDAAGPQAAATVRAQASRTAASPASVRPPRMGTSEAARIAGTSGQAVRAACASGRLAATKSSLTGQWEIQAGELRKWMDSRGA